MEGTAKIAIKPRGVFIGLVAMGGIIAMLQLAVIQRLQTELASSATAATISASHVMQSEARNTTLAEFDAAAHASAAEIVASN